jgi:hypothetical protein
MVLAVNMPDSFRRLGQPAVHRSVGFVDPAPERPSTSPIDFGYNQQLAFTIRISFPASIAAPADKDGRDVDPQSPHHIPGTILSQLANQHQAVQRIAFSHGLPRKLLINSRLGR